MHSQRNSCCFQSSRNIMTFGIPSILSRNETAVRCKNPALSSKNKNGNIAYEKNTRAVRVVLRSGRSDLTALIISGCAVAANLTLTNPALAFDSANPGFAKESYYVTLALFALTVPGLWSLIKRSTKSKVRQKVYEVPGPSQSGGMAMNDRAKQIVTYFSKYNYKIKSVGEVISFVGNYKPSTSQALSLVLYTFVGMVCTALVLSIEFPKVGNYWYMLTGVSPLAGAYYLRSSEREEEVKIKMVTSKDDQLTDITVEGDEEELDRLSKELGFMEKGKVYVKGILEK